MGMFYHFIDDEGVRLIGCEAAGHWHRHRRNTQRLLRRGSVGIFHGMKSYFCQDEDRTNRSLYILSLQALITLVSALNMRTCTPAAVLEYVPVTDDEAVDAFEYLSRLEGIIPAIESAHAVAHARKIAPTMSKGRYHYYLFIWSWRQRRSSYGEIQRVDLHE